MPAARAPTAAVTTAAAVALITVVSIAASVIASLRHYNNGPGRVVRSGIAVIRSSRRIVAIVGAAERGHAATEGK